MSDSKLKLSRSEFLSSEDNYHEHQDTSLSSPQKSCKAFFLSKLVLKVLLQNLCEVMALSNLVWKKGFLEFHSAIDD